MLPSSIEMSLNPIFSKYLEATDLSIHLDQLAKPCMFNGLLWVDPLILKNRSIVDQLSFWKALIQKARRDLHSPFGIATLLFFFQFLLEKGWRDAKETGALISGKKHQPMVSIGLFFFFCFESWDKYSYINLIFYRSFHFSNRERIWKRQDCWAYQRYIFKAVQHIRHRGRDYGWEREILDSTDEDEKHPEKYARPVTGDRSKLKMNSVIENMT